MVCTAFVSGLAVGVRPASLTRSSICGAAVRSAPVVSRSSLRMAEGDAAAAAPAMSPSMPFLPKPPTLSEDMIGYTGFDPLALSQLMDVKWLQESEIKHGRICMLAFLGMLVQEFVHLPDAAFSNPVATEAFGQVPAGGLWQIFIFCGIAEFILHKGRVSYTDMFTDGAEPGKLGFNPMNLKISDRIRLAEIKNGRLAMCGVGGVIHSMFIYKTPIVAQLLDFKAMPLNL